MSHEGEASIETVCSVFVIALSYTLLYERVKGGRKPLQPALTP